MGRKVLLAAICWLTLSQVSGEQEHKKQSNSVVAIDNESAESAPRLYTGHSAVYASAVPYSPHSFKGHSVLTASSQHAPVKVAGHPNSGLINLKDSYGKYVQSHQATYSPTYPQQFVPLQDLPPHLAQPLVSAASPSFNFKSAPNYFYGPHSYKVQEVQIPASQATHFGSISQPLVYLNDLRSFEPSNLHTTIHQVHTPDHKNNRGHQSNQPSHHPSFQIHHSKLPSNSNLQTHQASQPLTYPSNQEIYSHHIYPTTFHNNQENPNIHEIISFNKDNKQQGSHHEPGQLQASPAQTRVTAIVNGKKTVLNLETKPPVPYLDLNLLEPLKFDNPLVPQLQHFLPKVKGATYHKLPAYNMKKNKNYHKEFVMTKTKSYDSKSKTYPELKKQEKPQTPKKQSKPGISVKGHPNGGDYSYEINTPNHKETYNEQVIKYNKETNMKPVEVSYNEQSNKEPVVYTYVHSSKEPLKVTHVEYNSDDDDGPKHLVYNLSPGEKQEEQSNKVSEPTYNESEENSEESSAESDEDSPPTNSSCDNCDNNESPKYTQHDKQADHHESPKHLAQKVADKAPSKENYHHSSDNHSGSPKYTPQSNYYVKSPAHSSSKQPQQNVFIVEDTPVFQLHQDRPPVYHETPKQSHNLMVEHRGQEHNQKPVQNGKFHVVQSFSDPHNKHQVVQSFAEPPNLYQAIPQEYEENIGFLPENEQHTASIKVDPSQHLPNKPTVQTYVSFNPSNGAREGENVHYAPLQQQGPQQPHVQEKSKHIIVKDYQETPDEKHAQFEQVMAQMLDREENSEADFEKAYKDSALGFPAYEQVSEDIEKDIFDPDNYGKPKYHSEYNFEDTPFKEFQKEDDQFPKFSRLVYKDSRDNNQEDYYSDYAVHKPESYTDRIKNKVAYYKMLKQNRPEKSYLGHDGDKKEQTNAKFTLAPSFDFFKSSSSPKPKESKNVLVKYKIPAPVRYEFVQEAPRDSRAYSSRPSVSKYTTHFVEPKMQYGFEPLTPGLLFAESEMAAVASNNSPESEGPGTRKKMHREQWYLKKTTRSTKPSR